MFQLDLIAHDYSDLEKMLLGGMIIFCTTKCHLSLVTLRSFFKIYHYTLCNSCILLLLLLLLTLLKVRPTCHRHIAYKPFANRHFIVHIQLLPCPYSFCIHGT